MPGVPGRTLEAEGQEFKFLQLNLGKGKDAQDLLMSTARERGADEIGWAVSWVVGEQRAGGEAESGRCM